MKHLIIGLCLLLTSAAHAQHRHHHGYHRHHVPNWGWVAPAVIGGAIVYGMTRPMPPEPVYYIQQPTALPPAPLGYHYTQMLDGNCNCYRWVIMPN